jgi:N-acyl-D-aspartate/D-glutamate deacylase
VRSSRRYRSTFEEDLMPRPNNVRDAQRRLAELDSEYRRSFAKLDWAIARRSEILIQHERRVAAAQSEVEKTVALMAAEIGADLTAALLSLEVTQVRRVARSKARGVASAHVGSGATSEHRGGAATSTETAVRNNS